MNPSFMVDRQQLYFVVIRVVPNGVIQGSTAGQFTFDGIQTFASTMLVDKLFNFIIVLPNFLRSLWKGVIDTGLKI